MLVLERKKLNRSTNSSNSFSLSKKAKCTSAWAKSKIKRTVSLAAEQFEQDDYKKALLKEKTKHFVDNYVKPM
jgi:hypothetical protein